MTASRRPAARPGTFVPMLALASAGMFGLMALAIDLGMMTVARTELQQAADGAALAACRLLNNTGVAADKNNGGKALQAAGEVLLANDLMGTDLTPASVQNIRLGVYDYNSSTQKFDRPTQWGTNYVPPAGGGGATPDPGTPPTGKAWTAVEVTLGIQQPMFFAKVFGVSSMPNGARALAVHRPRDIAFVLDYSGSMGFNSVPSWPYTDNVNVNVGGLNSPDPHYPRFAHYARYASYNSSPNPASWSASAATATSRPHPFQMFVTHATTDYTFGPANTTTDARGGPPMTEGQYSADGSTQTAAGFCEADGNPSTINGSTLFNPAFSWGPPRTAKANTVTLTAATYNFSAYSASGRIATPAPPNFADQSDSPIAYVGDKWPRKDGGRGPGSTAGWAWSTFSSGNTWTENWAQTAKEFLGTRTFPKGTIATTTSAYDGSMLTTGTGIFDTVSGADGRRIISRVGDASRNFRFPGQSDHPTQSASSYVTEYGAVLDGTSSSTGATASPVTDIRDGGDTNDKFRDHIWEKFGYDLDVDDYRDPPATGSIKTINLLPAGQRFQGYSMGPGYWGKTFFMWPPDPRWGNPSFNPATGVSLAPLGGKIEPEFPDPNDPRKDRNGNWICDWRKRFFLRGDSTPSTPVYFNDQTDEINGILFASTRNTTTGAYTANTGHLLTAPTTTIASGNSASNQPGYYEINYEAVLAWLKANPKTLPGNLRAGRYVYYKSIPDNVDTSGTTDADLDKRFWREYIHFVLGVGSFDTTNYPVATTVSPAYVLASTESNLGLSLSITPPRQFDPNTAGTGNNNPGAQGRPYMAYTDNINRPRAHFWFGPLTMIHFLEYGGSSVRPWYAGTIREAQCWQLKAAMASVLDDVRVNHPNDFAGLSFFANRAEFRNPRAPMGQDWYTLKNALYFRRDVVNVLKQYPDDPVEYRPYTSGFAGNAVNEIPNSQGGTDPNNGLAIAYNLLSSSTSLTQWRSVTSPSGNTVSQAPEYGNRGRRGAAKIVVFETDGVPNATTTWRYTGTGANTYMTTGSGTTPSTTGITFAFGSANGNSGNTSAATAALAIVKMITANTTDTPPGFSLPNTKARVYTIGFGDLFEGWPTVSSMSGDGQDAHSFLLAMQKLGNTSGASDTQLPTRNIITGPYEQPDPTQAVSATNPLGRIEQLRDCLERMMQSGVQVTLIE